MSDDFIYSKIMSYVANQGGFDSEYEVINNITRSMGGGAEDSRYNDVLAGINRLPNIAPLPTYRELQGLVLFTKPELNLSYDNIAPVRQLAHLLTQDPNSLQYAVRMNLDPITYNSDKVRKTPLVDAKMPYISMLTNLIQTLSPPPDIGINVYTSPEGIYKESWMMPDGIAAYNGRYDLTATFNNPRNMVLLLIHTWLLFIGYLRVGPCVPHPEHRFQNTMPFNTRIERYKFDVHGEKVVQWFHTGAAVPTNISIGSGFSFNREEAMEMENKSISVQFACVGAVYNDPIQLYEFNARIVKYNSRMHPSVRNQHYVKIPKRYAAAANYLGYPWIDLGTNRIEWYIDPNVLSSVTKGL